MNKISFFLLFSFICGYSTPIEIESSIHLQRTENTAGIAVVKSVLVICDNYISPENNAIAQGVRVDLATVSQFLHVIESRGLVKVEKTLLQGRDATLERITSTVKNIQTGPNDIILVYFSGHGGMANGKSYVYTSDEKMLMRADLQNIVNTKSSRLKMIITDACNNESESMAASRSLSRGAADAAEGKYDAIYKELLNNYQGTLHLSASSEGQYAWSDDNLGGFFTHYFFKEGLIKNPNSSWETLFGTAKEKTSTMFRMLPAEQRSQLATEGIKDQTAKAFSLPKAAGTVTPNTEVKPVDNGSGIVIRNLTASNIAVVLDRNKDAANWKEALQENQNIGAGATLKPKGANLLIGFAKGAETVWYELETGKYFFNTDELGQTDLFLEEEGKTVEEISKKDYAKILVGQWEWEDSAGIVTTNFSADGRFIENDEDGEAMDQGVWNIIKYVDPDDQQAYSLLSLSMEYEEDAFNIMYLITSDDDDLLQLIYVGTIVENALVEEEKSDDESSVMLMYRK